MAVVAFLGLGAMGRRMAEKLRDAGHELRVWNRSGVPEGVNLEPAKTPRAAAEGADFVFSMVRDDAASEAVWETPETGALQGLAKGALALECSTLTPGRAIVLAEAVEARGATFLDAPVVGTRPQADAGALVFLLGGAAADAARVQPILEPMAAAMHHMGAQGAGAKTKLMVNTLLGVQVAFNAELLGWAERSGLPKGEVFEVIAGLPVMSPAAKMLGGFMLQEKFAPLFPVELVAKDFDYALHSAESAGASLPMVAAARGVFHRALEAGLGDENLTAAAKLY